MTDFEKLSRAAAEVSKLAADCERYNAYSAHLDKIDEVSGLAAAAMQKAEDARKALTMAETEQAEATSRLDELDRITAGKFSDVKSREDAARLFAESEKKMNQLLADVIISRCGADHAHIDKNIARTDEANTEIVFDKRDNAITAASDAATPERDVQIGRCALTGSRSVIGGTDTVIGGAKYAQGANGTPYSSTEPDSALEEAIFASQSQKKGYAVTRDMFDNPIGEARTVTANSVTANGRTYICAPDPIVIGTKNCAGCTGNKMCNKHFDEMVSQQH